jgi:hypothetical protein
MRGLHDVLQYPAQDPAPVSRFGGRKNARRVTRAIAARPGFGLTNEQQPRNAAIFLADAKIIFSVDAVARCGLQFSA